MGTEWRSTLPQCSLPLPTGFFSRAGYGYKKGKNENKSEREQNMQMTEDKWREEMQPESLEREVSKNHYNMWDKFLF